MWQSFQLPRTLRDWLGFTAGALVGAGCVLTVVVVWELMRVGRPVEQRTELAAKTTLPSRDAGQRLAFAPNASLEPVPSPRHREPPAITGSIGRDTDLEEPRVLQPAERNHAFSLEPAVDADAEEQATSQEDITHADKAPVEELPRPAGAVHSTAAHVDPARPSRPDSDPAAITTETRLPGDAKAPPFPLPSETSTGSLRDEDGRHEPTGAADRVAALDQSRQQLDDEATFDRGPIGPLDRPDAERASNTARHRPTDAAEKSDQPSLPERRPPELRSTAPEQDAGAKPRSASGQLAQRRRAPKRVARTSAQPQSTAPPPPQWMISALGIDPLAAGVSAPRRPAQQQRSRREDWAAQALRMEGRFLGGPLPEPSLDAAVMSPWAPELPAAGIGVSAVEVVDQPILAASEETGASSAYPGIETWRTQIAASALVARAPIDAPWFGSWVPTITFAASPSLEHWQPGSPQLDVHPIPTDR